jgi:hypothetical protein
MIWALVEMAEVIVFRLRNIVPHLSNFAVLAHHQRESPADILRRVATIATHRKGGEEGLPHVAARRRAPTVADELSDA